MVDFRGHILTRCATKLSNAVVTIGFIISDACAAADITDEDNFAIALEWNIFILTKFF